MKNKEVLVEKYENNLNFKVLVDWQSKIDFLNKQAEVISKIKKFPIFPITAFILKAQSIEFELKQLIPTLVLYSNVYNITNGGDEESWKEARTPKELKIPMGKLIGKIEEINYVHTKKLQNDLKYFVEIRNKFVHHLFDVGDLDCLIEEANKGLKLAKEISKEIKNQFKICSKIHRGVIK
jgi:hypothetical protein